MGSTKFEKFIFSLITCVLMVFIMTWYNGFMDYGKSIDFIETLILFFPICAAAFIIDWFIVSFIVRKTTGLFLKNEDPLIKKVLIMTFFMVLGMASMMSLLSTLVHGHTGADFPVVYGAMWLRNFPVALLLNLLIVGPIARGIFFKIFPQNAQ